VKSYPKLDANHGDVLRALLEIGCSVQSLASVGLGVPDLLCGIAGINILIEVKDGSLPPSKRKLEPDQTKWHNGWKGQHGVANSPEEAVAIVRAALTKENSNIGAAPEGEGWAL
jgi:hypothetical protein